jgi:hypothetical protein
MVVWSFLFLEKNRRAAENGYGTSGVLVPASESFIHIYQSNTDVL